MEKIRVEKIALYKRFSLKAMRFLRIQKHSEVAHSSYFLIEETVV